MFQGDFCRYEFKFPVTYDIMDRMVDDLAPYVEMDKNGNEYGYYTISSLYFDNDRRECFYETVNRDRFRQKLRLRVYGAAGGDSMSFFEIKSKLNGLVMKRRTRLPLRDAVAFAQSCMALPAAGTAYAEEALPDFSAYHASSPQVLREICRLIRLKELKPKNVVSYDRMALFSREDPELRITFDVNIRTRDTELDLTAGSYGQPRIPEKTAVLEVKTGKDIPYWLVKILAEYRYRNQTFSKYCSHYEDAALLQSRNG